MKAVRGYTLVAIAWLVELLSRLLLPALALAVGVGMLWLLAWAVMELWRML